MHNILRYLLHCSVVGVRGSNRIVFLDLTKGLIFWCKSVQAYVWPFILSGLNNIFNKNFLLFTVYERMKNVLRKLLQLDEILWLWLKYTFLVGSCFLFSLNSSLFSSLQENAAVFTAVASFLTLWCGCAVCFLGEKKNFCV